MGKVEYAGYRIGLPKQTAFRRYDLVDMDAGILLACTHPIADSALCQDCRTLLLSQAREVIYDVIEKEGMWVESK